MARSAEATAQFNRLVQARGRLAAQAARQDPLIFDINLSGAGGSIGSKMVIPPNGEWNVLKIKEIMLTAVGSIVLQQKALDNPVEKLFVDESPFKAIDRFDRNITLLFQSGNNVRPVMNALQAEVRRRIKGATWTWRVKSPSPARERMLRSAVMGSGPVLLEFGEAIFYFPSQFSSNPDPTYANILYKQGRAPDGSGKLKRRPPKTGRTGGKGWYGLTATALRGIGKKQGVYVKAQMTFDYMPTGRILPPGQGLGKGPNGTFYQGAWGFIIRLNLGARRNR